MNNIEIALLSFVSMVLPLVGTPGALADSGKAPAPPGTVEAELREDAKDAFQKQPDALGLPRVLIIGDSISIGYTAPLQKLLQGRAVVSRAPRNCQDSGFGLQHLKQWIGKGPWDVIHFNFGIWDTHYLNARTGKLIPSAGETSIPADARRIRHDLDQYRTNLVKIVQVLKETKAHLIWAQSTPIMFRTGARFDDIARYNAVAAEVMKENGVMINDLYNIALPDIKKWQSPDQCHFTATGSTMLAQHVMESILAALEPGKERSGAEAPGETRRK